MTKKNDTWMPLYVGDYLADTSRLNTEQHGAYLLILMDYWRNGPPLDDDEELANITKLSVAQWRKHGVKIRAFFRSEGGRLVSKRADEERLKAGHISSKRSEAGKQGAKKRWGKDDGSDIANAMANDIANASQRQSQNDRPSQSQSQTTKKPTAATISAEGGEAGTDSPPPSRSVQLVTLLRSLEKDRGKFCRDTSSTPYVIAWADKGVTDDQLREAHALAVQARDKVADQSPINAGFLDCFIADLLNPAPGKSSVGAVQASRPWFMTWSAIEAKGKELGLVQGEDELAPIFKLRVYEASGVTEDMVRKAKIDLGERV